MDGLPSASVIIATCNRPRLLGDLMESVGRLDPVPDEVVICDDSAPGTALTPPVLPCRVRIVRNTGAHGPGAARNLAVHSSRGDLLLFTDDDCIVAPGWAGALAGTLSNSPEVIAGVGGRVLARDSDVFSRYYEYHRILEPRPHDAARPDEIPYLVTANAAVRRDPFMRAGGFDTRIPTAGGEDAAMSLRIAKLGFRFRRAETAIVKHRFRPSFRDFAKTFHRYGLGGRYVVDRYLPL